MQAIRTQKPNDFDLISRDVFVFRQEYPSAFTCLTQPFDVLGSLVEMIIMYFHRAALGTNRHGEFLAEISIEKENRVFTRLRGDFHSGSPR